MARVLAVTDLTSASYQLVGFAAFIARPTEGEVVLVSAYGGLGARRSDPPSHAHANVWRDELEARLRQEGQLLERQRQWCSDRGVRCRAELYEGGAWPDFVLQSAERAQADLILVGTQLLGPEGRRIPTADLERLAEHAACPVSMVQLPTHSAFSSAAGTTRLDT